MTCAMLPTPVRVLLLLAVALAAGRTALAAPAGSPAEWPAYGRDPGGTRYAPPTQIDKDNVGRLEIAWTYRTGEFDVARQPAWKNYALQVTPILVDGTMYICSVFGKVIALDPETGVERWRFDARIDPAAARAELACRGVSTWRESDPAFAGLCARRIFYAAVTGRLYALDAATGAPCADFGAGGQVDLTQGVGPVEARIFGVTSPPAVVGDVLVVGSAIGDNQRVEEARGTVRAIDVRTGRERWRWDPIPRRRDDPARATWEGDSADRTGAANAWSILSADPDRNLVFVPVGSASPDFYGGERRGANRWADSVVALRASTGELVWGFQTVHHDLWDYDVPAQPTLVTVRRDGREVPAVAQATKVGHLFVLDRETGAPLFPVEERPVPPSDVPGEQAYPTQPFPVLPRPLVPHALRPEDAWGLTPLDRAACRKRIAAMRGREIFTPPGLEPTIIYPGNAGGTNWGSVAFEPQRGFVIVNTSRFPTVVRLIPRADYPAEKAANPGREVSPQEGTPYAMRRDFDALLSPLGLPCNPPPWGTLVAVDLGSGEVRWEVPLGTVRDIAPVPIPWELGTPSMGGPMITAAGLVFIGGAMDNYLRAFDIDTGKELWKGRLPAGGQATPMTYQLRPDGKQYVVIAAGGHGRLGTTLGDSIVAFALP